MTSAAFRRPIPSITDAELSAINAIRGAYMACNATDLNGQDSPLVHEITPGNTYGGQPTAMGHLAEAGRIAWRQVGITDVDMWEVMSDSGEGARYVFDLYVKGDLEGRFQL